MDSNSSDNDATQGSSEKSTSKRRGSDGSTKLSETNGASNGTGKRKVEVPVETPATKKSRRSDYSRRVSPRLDSMATLVKATSDEETCPSPPESQSTTSQSKDEVSKHVDLPPLPDTDAKLTSITQAERKELERYLELSKDDSWKDDWMGNLVMADKEILNPDGKSRDRAKKALFQWAGRGKISRKLLFNLVRVVYNSSDIVPQAKRILATADPDSGESIQEAVRRVSYDPVVLQQDGWTTMQSEEPIGASGGPHRIGERLYWEGHEGVVIAYVHDDEIGDLWKAMDLERFDTYDLEVEELEEAKKKLERRKRQKDPQGSSKASSTASKPDVYAERRSGRHASVDYQVPGIEHGIVLAVSFSRGARPGVFWPARVVHFSEIHSTGSMKRAASKQKVDVVFLAPYWNAVPQVSGGRRMESYSDSIQRHGTSIFDSGPLFDVETIDVSPESILEYPYEADRGLDIEELYTSFKFAGLPNAAFGRFVASHRLALGLKTYSQNVLLSRAATEIDKTTAGLFEAHPLAGQTACFPDAVLHLPFGYILSQLPAVETYKEQMATGESCGEPALQLGGILETMKPPACWGESSHPDGNQGGSSDVINPKPFASPSLHHALDINIAHGGTMSLDHFMTNLKFLPTLFAKNDSSSKMLIQCLDQLLTNIPTKSDDVESLSFVEKKVRLKSTIKLWIVAKVNKELFHHRACGYHVALTDFIFVICPQSHGESLICNTRTSDRVACLTEWRRSCERLYKHLSLVYSCDNFGNGISSVVSDATCNLHVTSNECFERAVRLPAAMKAVKQVVLDSERHLTIVDTVQERYIDLAEKEVIQRAHSRKYLKRIKSKCMEVTREGEVVALTEDSDGKGGEDTKGTRGSWKAAITAVGASIQAVDMLVYGECVNAFCVTRPPGHHAGRELHPMKAVSNGFCLLNNAACAALYATTPISEGGTGLQRVCVIDFDVHHGNGTQNILCSTYDPRFLYVSIHAGGVDVNGVDPSTEPDQFNHHLARSAKTGIYPGRCGDTSPHQGVLNIPLGSKVTSHALGVALVTKVTPAVEKFAPDLIIVSAGFDAHKNDPLGLGGLSAEDFGTLTEVLCKLAHKSCSGRLLSVLEGGYGVPCCRMPENLFNPEEAKATHTAETDPNGELKNENVLDSKENDAKASASSSAKEPAGNHDTSNGLDNFANKPLDIMDLGDELPGNMKDDMPYALMKRLDKCHAEGFLECVREHVSTMAKCNLRG
eukprot:Nitzschia sp. Nitz4//scaffold7_size249615//129249//133007//NITZ4_001180-RA/size249615-augustus-gene-0.32-mRNA-1//-1//CDS//3329558451//2521//frame0